MLEKEMPSQHASMSRIIIVGRQNVGKSTLYNRLLGKRTAITDSTPGVTRDVLWSEWWCRETQSQCLLCDTGGQTEKGSELEQQVTQIAQQTYHTTAVILFVVDIHHLTAYDEMVAASLMPYRERVICVLNKADRQQEDLLEGDFLRFNFKMTMAISAEHNRNISKLSTAIGRVMRSLIQGNASLNSEMAGTSDTSVSIDDGVPIDDTDAAVSAAHYTVAVIGKPNSGKSTLINALTKRDISLVSDQPGTTRDTVHAQWRFNVYGRNNIVNLIDTAGLRRTSKINERLEYYALVRTQNALQNADIILLLIDSSIGLTDNDKKIAQRATALGRGVIIVNNKIDLVARGAKAHTTRKEQFRYRFPHLAYAPLIEISALKQSGFASLREETAMLWTMLNSRVPTPQLNRAAQEWIAERSPDNRAHLMYATQINANPLRFVFFFKRLKSASPTLRSYLTNRLRSSFNLHHVPILLELRNGREIGGKR